MDTLTQLKKANKLRDEQIFKHFNLWQPVDWSNAIAGETGELCNMIKKMKRLNIASDYIVTKKDVADEAADIVIYLDILCQNMGIDLSEAIVDKFNSTSIRYNRPDIQLAYHASE